MHAKGLNLRRGGGGFWVLTGNKNYVAKSDQKRKQYYTDTLYDTILSNIKGYRGKRGELPTEVRMITAYILSLIGKKTVAIKCGWVFENSCY